jgi:DNA-directed RNA polymerase specialized sigma24 family protein
MRRAPIKAKNTAKINNLIIHESNSIRQLKEILSSLEKKYDVDSKEILDAIKSDIIIPVTIFSSRLTALESVVKFLREEKGSSFHEIGILLGRNERNIWHAYHHGYSKQKKSLPHIDTRYSVPVSIFKDAKLSALESLVFYLKNTYSLSYHEIAVLIQRDDRTVWTVYQRALK